MNMSPCGSTLEEQISPIMNALAKAAVSEISQLFSEGSATLRLQITRSLKENEALRTRMKVMRRELLSLRLQTRSNASRDASRAASRLALARANICRPWTKPLGNEDCDDFGDSSTQRSATPESLHGSSHMSSHSEELRILSADGKGEGPQEANGHDALFTTSEVEGVSSLSADHSVTKRLERGEELSVQQTPDAVLIKVEEDIGGGMPAVEDCDDFGDRSTQRGATSESLHVDILGSSHMSSHSEELRILSVAKSLERGEWRVHLEELPGHRGGRKGRPCVLLGKGVPDNTKMTIPMRTRTRERPYGCDQCMKRFTRNDHLTFHMRIHTGERPYRCDQCMKRFSWSSNLKRHMMTHSGEKPYRCDQCMKSFSRNSHLKEHMRTHSGEKTYRCNQCMTLFISNSHLKEHMRTHSGEKPYRCDQCMKSYSTSFSLKIHMRTHSGEKPFRCDQCMKSFIRKSHMKIHMRTHTGDSLQGEALQVEPMQALQYKLSPEGPHE